MTPALVIALREFARAAQSLADVFEGLAEPGSALRKESYVDGVWLAAAALWGVDRAVSTRRTGGLAELDTRLAVSRVLRDAGLSYPEIGRAIGRSHSSVMSGLVMMRDGDVATAVARSVELAEHLRQRDQP